ncbi:MAG: hypothetical protein JSV89_11235 [Spirochaetaceae bacterium]|nr:MAG: hypothetical protein JSV89_11235 [Spirochaetaceae bacterium]
MSVRLKNSLLIGLIFALFISSNPIYAQERDSTAGRKGGMGYFIGGVGWMLESGSSSIVYSTGGGGHSITNKWILGGEGHSSFGPENAGGYGFLNVGYALLATSSIIVYPLLGLGGGAMTREASPTVSKCALLNPSLGVDYLIPIKGRSGILLGLRGGYTFTVYSNTFNWSMPHIRLVVGGFGFGE